jgi:hypothetical protein
MLENAGIGAAGARHMHIIVRGIECRQAFGSMQIVIPSTPHSLLGARHGILIRGERLAPDLLTLF